MRQDISGAIFSNWLRAKDSLGLQRRAPHAIVSQQGIEIMLDPKNQRYAKRIQELKEEGLEVAKLEKRSYDLIYIQDEDQIRLHAWLINVGNILETVFGENSLHNKHFKDVLPRDGIKFVEHSYDIFPIIGVLTGALDDLEKGFLIGQEFIIAGEVFDTILEQARYLNSSGYKDPAAVLARVVLEDTLKRLARSLNIDSDRKASIINEDLRQAGLYAKPQWRFIQAWLDVGNAAAHGDFNDYDREKVEKMITGIEQFLISNLK